MMAINGRPHVPQTAKLTRVFDSSLGLASCICKQIGSPLYEITLCVAFINAFFVWLYICDCCKCCACNPLNPDNIPKPAAASPDTAQTVVSGVAVPVKA